MSFEDNIKAMNAAVEQNTQNIMAMQQASQNPYLALRSTFGMQGTTVPYRPGFGPVDTGQRGYIMNSDGAMLFSNGVIVDPEGHIFMPPPSVGLDPSEIEGSQQWAIRVSQTWSDKRANQWRKRLWNQGFQGAGLLQSEKGGMAQDLIDALKVYHQNRYVNGGTVQPLAPVGKEIAENVRRSFDPVMVKEQVKSWGQVPFEEDLDDHTASYFADRTIQLAVQLAKHHKDWTLDQVQQGAEVRAQKEFLEQPGVKSSIQDAEDDEMSTKIRDSVVSIAQLGGIS